MTAVSPRLPFEYYLLDRVAFDGGLACRLGGKLVPSGSGIATGVAIDSWDWRSATALAVSM
ncbi:hypothetical protein K9B32_08895 [Rhizobium sp. 3T7]|uniref:hypothetical protein n=1 Tax=Rhizobium sp. 3T7 TaxID=2874922 RepID=UPI001CCB4116|nr:hypothetical protein [Rhizobium sp. 3T7]MBZ9790246.1 hypothetical protein [Rhizobium sp. 3T7]